MRVNSDLSSVYILSLTFLYWDWLQQNFVTPLMYKMIDVWTKNRQRDKDKC